MNSGSYDQRRTAGNRGERIQLGPASEGGGASAEEEKRDVAAELGGDGGQAAHGDYATGQDRQRKQDGGGIRGAASETGAQGNALPETDLDAAGQAQLLEAEAGGLHDQVVRDVQVGLEGDRGFAPRREGNVEAVGE